MKVLPRTMVGFSATDLDCYRRMQAWRAGEQQNFDFVDCLVSDVTGAEAEAAMRRRFRERIETVRTFLVLIGTDTKFNDSPVRWQVETALIKQQRIIAVNIDGWRRMNPKTCPAALHNIGATFVPYSPEIIAYALVNTQREVTGNWEFPDDIYEKLGYALSGNRAVRKAGA